MTNPKNGTVEGGERPARRRPPTIDLEATEIASDPVADTAARPAVDAAEHEKAAGMTDSPGREPAAEITAPRAAPGPTSSRRWRFVGGFAAGVATAALLGAAALWFVGVVPFHHDNDRDPLLAAKVAALDRRIQALATPTTAPPPSR